MKKSKMNETNIDNISSEVDNVVTSSDINLTKIDSNSLEIDNSVTSSDISLDTAATTKIANKNGKTATTKIANKNGKTATGMKIIAILLYVFAFAIMMGMTLSLAIKSYTLAPYYSFWPFLGTVFIFIFALVFLIVALCVTKRKSTKTIRNQTVCLVITFFCLTGGFGILMNVAFPDLISLATQGTLHTEDMYNSGEDQIEENAGLVRQYIRYNILNGNMDGQYAYKEMAKPRKSSDGRVIGYVDKEIQDLVDDYKDKGLDEVNETIKYLSGHKKELFDFIYNSYILMDYDYALLVGEGLYVRHTLALALTDKAFTLYSKLCKEGTKNPRLKYLLENNFRSFDQDGYLTFDDPLLLFAQMEGRMTIPTVVRLILDNKYTYTEPTFNDAGDITGYDGYLYELYAPEIRDEFVKDGGVFVDGKGVNKQGYIVYETGHVKKPMAWCVLDMDGNVMDVAKIDMAASLGSIGGIISGLIGMPVFTDAIKQLLDQDIVKVINVAANGAKLALHLYIDDDGQLAISVVPANVEFGTLGYAQMSWLNANNLLFGVINLISIRNILMIFGAIGLVMILGASLCREYGKKKKEEQIAEKEAEENAEALA